METFETTVYAQDLSERLRGLGTPVEKPVKLLASGSRLGVKLTADAADATARTQCLDLAKAIDPALHADVNRLLPKLLSHEKALFAWLKAGQDRAALLTRDPIAALKQAVPNIAADDLRALGEVMKRLDQEFARRAAGTPAASGGTLSWLWQGAASLWDLADPAFRWSDQTATARQVTQSSFWTAAAGETKLAAPAAIGSMPPLTQWEAIAAVREAVLNDLLAAAAKPLLAAAAYSTTFEKTIFNKTVKGEASFECGTPRISLETPNLVLLVPVKRGSVSLAGVTLKLAPACLAVSIPPDSLVAATALDKAGTGLVVTLKLDTTKPPQVSVRHWSGDPKQSAPTVPGVVTALLSDIVTPVLKRFDLNGLEIPVPFGPDDRKQSDVSAERPAFALMKYPGNKQVLLHAFPQLASCNVGLRIKASDKGAALEILLLTGFGKPAPATASLPQADVAAAIHNEMLMSGVMQPVLWDVLSRMCPGLAKTNIETRTNPLGLAVKGAPKVDLDALRSDPLIKLLKVEIPPLPLAGLTLGLRRLDLATTATGATLAGGIEIGWSVLPSGVKLIGAVEVTTTVGSLPGFRPDPAGGNAPPTQILPFDRGAMTVRVDTELNMTWWQWILFGAAVAAFTAVSWFVGTLFHPIIGVLTAAISAGLLGVLLAPNWLVQQILAATDADSKVPKRIELASPASRYLWLLGASTGGQTLIWAEWLRSTLGTGEALVEGGRLVSPNRKHQLRYSAGKVVLESLNADGSASVQKTFAEECKGGRFVMQTDGNLVLYNANKTPVWAANEKGGTFGKEGQYPDAVAVLGDAGTFQVVCGKDVLWQAQK